MSLYRFFLNYFRQHFCIILGPRKIDKWHSQFHSKVDLRREEVANGGLLGHSSFFRSKKNGGKLIDVIRIYIWWWGEGVLHRGLYSRPFLLRNVWCTFQLGWTWREKTPCLRRCITASSKWILERMTRGPVYADTFRPTAFITETTFAREIIVPVRGKEFFVTGGCCKCFRSGLVTVY